MVARDVAAVLVCQDPLRYVERDERGLGHPSVADEFLLEREFQSMEFGEFDPLPELLIAWSLPFDADDATGGLVDFHEARHTIHAPVEPLVFSGSDSKMVLLGLSREADDQSSSSVMRRDHFSVRELEAPRFEKNGE